MGEGAFKMLTDRLLWTMGVCLVGEELWFSTVEFNGLFRADIKTGQISFVSPISVCDKTQYACFSCIIQIENSIYLCPYTANCICEYDIQNNKMQSWSLEPGMVPYVNRANCFHDKIYMFCDNLHLIIVFDPKTKEISYIHEDADRKYNFDKVWDIVCLGKALYFVEGCNIIETDLQFKIISKYNISEYSKGEDILTIAYHEDKFWMMSTGARLISWNKEENKACIYSVPKSGTAFKSLIWENSLYTFYPDTNNILITDLENKKTTSVHAEIFSGQDGKLRVFLPFLKKNIKGIFIYSYINSGINYIKPNGEVEYRSLYMDNLEQFLKDYMKSGFYTEKSSFQSLKIFLDWIDCIYDEKQAIIPDIGRIIYNEIKESKGNGNGIK